MLFSCCASFGMMTGVGIVGIFSFSFPDSLSDISIPKLVALPLQSFFLVLCMPAFGFFILPFGVAGNGARYLRMKLRLLMNGMPVIWLLSAASMSILRGSLKMIGACIFCDFACTEVFTRMHLRHVRWIVDCILWCICPMLQYGDLSGCVFGLSSDL